MSNTPRVTAALAVFALLGAAMVAAAGCSSSTADSSEEGHGDLSVPQKPEGAGRVADLRAGPLGKQEPPKGEDSPSAKEPPKSKPKKEKYDPVKENGPIFVGWPKPRLAIVITGQQMGYLEPCGCAGLDRMKGGLSRRHSLFGQLRGKRGWPVVGLDVGGNSKGFGLQAELKFHLIADALRKMGYAAAGLGTSDLRMPTSDLLSEAAPIGEKPGLLISSNAGLFGFDAGFTGQPRIVEAAGMKIGVISVLGKQYQKQINNPELEMADPEAVLIKQLPELKKKCDLLVLLAHATMKESIALGRKFPDFDLVVTAGGAPEPPARAALIEGTKKTRLIEVGEKGMNAIVVAWFDDPSTPFRYQRVPLDSRFANSEDMKQLMAAYQGQLKDLGLEGLGIRAVSHPRKETNGSFVGSAKCESCHEPSYDVWKKSGHRKGWKTLVELDPPRNFDPECISCHVVGWNPQKYFPYESGFQSAEKTPHLFGVGCENCHGPGQNHVAAEMGNDKPLQEAMRKAVVVTKADAEKRLCLECHDLDNSPDFDFKTYWPKVEHPEDD